MSNVTEQAIAILENEKKALWSQWETEMSDENRPKIWKRIELKDNEINRLKQTGNVCKLADFRANWDDKLVKIDFKKAKDLIEKFKKDCLDKNDRRYALLLLDNAIAMEGRLMLRWLENYLRREYSNWTEPFVHGFTTTVTKEGFISSLAMRYKFASDITIGDLVKKLRSQFCTGEIFMIKIEIQTADASEFLLWFVQEFWQQFTEGLDGSFAVVAAIAIDSQFKDKSLPADLFCQAKVNGQINGQKMKRLPLQNWTQDDVEFWLLDHSGLGKRGCDTKDFKVIANSVWGVAKGKPESTRNALLKSLDRLLTQAMQMEERT